MSSKFQTLIPATPFFNESGALASAQYGDIYHSDAGALAQARHVFLGGNQLPERWRGKAQFAVCEIGFGLGNNFLALWSAWRSDPRRSERLHVLAFEAHPFTRPDLERLLRSHDSDDAIRGLARQLVAAWPPLLPGLHRLEFEGGALTLTLAFGPVERLVRQVSARIDAFFLDGFAPQRNPEMWSRSLFGQLVRIANPGATAASWCCAGVVRRALRDAGFLVSKAPGLGSKWAMMVARLRPGLAREIPSATGHPVMVVGGGLAGAGAAQSLAMRGHDVVVLDPAFIRGRGASHRGHLAAALTPVISRDDDFRSRLSRAGSQRALQRWMKLAGPARPLRCGTIELMAEPTHAQERLTTLQRLQFPRDWVRWMEPLEVSQRTGLPAASPGVWFADGLLVQPEALLEALLDSDRIRCVAAHVQRVGRGPGGDWAAYGDDGAELARAPTLVLANAGGSGRLLAGVPEAPALPKVAAMMRLAGQVSYFPERFSSVSMPILSGEGYWLPSVNGRHVAGSTYAADILVAEMTYRGHQEVVSKATRLLAAAGHALGSPRVVGGWAGQRAAVADRLPVIGPVAHAAGLWLACGYGSRGLTWSALGGEIIAASLNNEPMPLERELMRTIAPR
jgi:tRNA 5-methylaminomethyl-2-thiouridine biosynthesis bifunctional protein